MPDSAMNSAIQSITPILIASGGAAAAVIGILRFFGSKWIDKYFAQQLKELERRQQEILNKQQYEINSLLSRVSKIHEKEYDTLPRAWVLLQDACDQLKDLSNPLQSFPNLNRCTSSELAEFLDKSILSEIHKKKILEQPDKNLCYRTATYWIRLKVVGESIREFRKYLLYNRIFLSRDLFSLFREIELAIIEVQAHLETPDNTERPYERNTSAFREMIKKVNQLNEQIEIAVQNRLHISDA